MMLLSEILSLNVANKSVTEKIQWLTTLNHWVFHSKHEQELISGSENRPSARIRFILLQLNKEDSWRQHLVQVLSDILIHISLNSELAYSGYHQSDSYIQEFVGRIKEKILPQAPPGENLSSLMSTLFPKESDSILIDHLDEAALSELMALFKNETTFIQNLHKALLEASSRLAMNILNLTIQIHKTNKLTNKPLTHLYEYRLAGSLILELQNLEKGQLEKDPTDTELFQLIRKIDSHIEKSQNYMNSTGINTEMVYRFQLQKKQLARLNILLNLFYNRGSSAMQLRLLMAHLIIDTHHQQSLSYFFYENMHHLVEKIVQSNSEIGEHYVGHKWIDFGKMYVSAAVGGVVTSFTVFIKIGIGKVFAAGFLKGFAYSLNYAGSFLAIAAAGGTLATKQPSATAPYLARALKSSSITDAKNTILGLLRTQFIATLGNVTLVAPVCFAVAFLMNYLGHPLFTPEEALHTFESSNFTGPSGPYAALTGLLLFLGSIFSGWFQNFYTLNQLDQRLRSNPTLTRFLGTERLHHLSDKITSKVGVIAGNVILGFLLGLVPEMIKFFGIPSEVRHITLQSGYFATSLPQMLEVGVSWTQLLNAASGLFLIAILNISVSFLLALFVASFATETSFNRLMVLLRWGLKMVLTRPLQFIVPEDEEKDYDATSTDLSK